MRSLISLTMASASTLCMAAPKAMFSIHIPGQVKHPSPKYFSMMGPHWECSLITSPIRVSLVILASVSVNGNLLFYQPVKIGQQIVYVNPVPVRALFDSILGDDAVEAHLNALGAVEAVATENPHGLRILPEYILDPALPGDGSGSHFSKNDPTGLGG